MRIVYWAPHPGVYTGQVMGAGPHIRGVVGALRRGGHEVLPIFGGDILGVSQDGRGNASNSTAPSRLRNGLKKIVPASLKNDLRVLSLNGRVFAEAVASVERFSPDVIYERAAYLNRDGPRLARRFGVRYVLESDASGVELAGLEWGSTLGFYARWLDRRKHRLADMVVVSSQRGREALSARGYADRSRIRVKELGVDLDDFDESNADGERVRRDLGLRGRVVVGYHGSFLRHHGIELLMEAAKTLGQSDPDVVFLLVGGGGVQEESQEFATANGLKNVVFTGLIRENLRDYLDAMDIAVVPHVRLHVQYPMKLLEYGAMKRAVIAPRLEIFDGVLEHDVTSWLVEPDSVESIVEAIRLLSHDRELRTRLGLNFYGHVTERFTWDRVAERIVEAMSECL